LKIASKPSNTTSGYCSPNWANSISEVRTDKLVKKRDDSALAKPHSMVWTFCWLPSAHFFN
jgi:hypothetical protein